MDPVDQTVEKRRRDGKAGKLQQTPAPHQGVKMAERAQYKAQGRGKTGRLGGVNSKQARDASEEAGRLEVDPAACARVIGYYAETHVTNEKGHLEGYVQGTRRRRDFKTLKVGGGITGEIVDEVGRRIARYTP